MSFVFWEQQPSSTRAAKKSWTHHDSVLAVAIWVCLSPTWSANAIINKLYRCKAKTCYISAIGLRQMCFNTQEDVVFGISKRHH